jgi:protein-tyrosine phosphatase
MPVRGGLAVAVTPGSHARPIGGSSLPTRGGRSESARSPPARLRAANILPVSGELRWDACLNVRDVGDRPTRAGWRTRSGALVRADSLCRLTPAGRAALIDYGVRTVIDLQRPEEQIGPHPFAEASADDGRPRYLNLLPGAYRDAAGEAALRAAQGHVAIYRTSLDVHQRGFGAICRAIATADAGGVLVHCWAGKDRTGIVVAMLLALVGVADDLIAADYALSYPNMAPEYERQLDARGVAAPAERDAFHRARRSDPETILAALAHLRERHGGPAAYLRAAGLADHELDVLHDRLLD